MEIKIKTDIYEDLDIYRNIEMEIDIERDGEKDISFSNLIC